MPVIKVTTKLQFNDYLKASYYLMYRTFSMKFLSFLGIACLILSLIQYEEEESFNFLAFIFGIVIIIIPVSLYFISKKTYHTTRIHETMTFEIDAEVVKVKGESFDSTFTWDKIDKVSETKSWIFLWQTRYSTHIIAKKDFSGYDLTLLKNIVDSHKEVKNKMR
ncbi:MAG: YcxB family protein [Bacteroidales bacterium]|nr:YcxB family protein [Bacteroidales bacterium]